MFVFLFSQYDLWSEKFSPNRSFLKILRTIPMGVTITKKIASITIGGTTFPRSAPSFIHKRLKGFSNTGLRNDKSNNIPDMSVVKTSLKKWQEKSDWGLNYGKRKSEAGPNGYEACLRFNLIISK